MEKIIKTISVLNFVSEYFIFKVIGGFSLKKKCKKSLVNYMRK